MTIFGTILILMNPTLLQMSWFQLKIALSHRTFHLPLLVLEKVMK